MMRYKFTSLLLPLRYSVKERSICSQNLGVELLNKRTILKLTGPDTTNYLQSMITNDIRKIDDTPAIYSLLLNSRGRVLYDILLYKISGEEYLVEYDKTAAEYLHKHLFMYRLRKNVNIEPTKEFQPWVVHPTSEPSVGDYESSLHALVESVRQKDNVVESVIDPRTNLLGVRVVTKTGTNLLPLLDQKDLKFSESDSYREYRYKLGIGEGVTDHPPGVCLSQDTNVDYLNGVSFSKGCYIGQELTARLHFTLTVAKRLMPVVLEPWEVYPELAPEAAVVNDKGEKMGRLRSHLGPYGLALLKVEACLKATQLLLKEEGIKLTTKKPKWWPNHN